MTFTTVFSGEIITIDTNLRMITSNKTLIQDRFNGKYMYLVQGNNAITVTGTIDVLTIEYTPARKVGS
jgi:phage-related protein